MQFRINKGGTDMSMISLAAMPIGIEAHSTDHSFKTIVLFSCLGLVASISLMAIGVDLSAISI
jgi:hypothetical protein